MTASSPLIAIDLTRLSTYPLTRTPRGIDRVELAYAQYLLGRRRGNLAVIPTVWGMRAYSEERAMAGIARLQKHWSEFLEPATDRVFADIVSTLGGSAANLGSPIVLAADRLSVSEQLLAYLDLIRATGISFGVSVKNLPSKAMYLNVGQFSAAYAPAVRWLEKRPDISSVWMIHDTIPIDSPEWVTERGRDFHWRVLKNASRYANAVIVPSRCAAESVGYWLTRIGGTKRIHVEPLAVGEEFLLDNYNGSLKGMGDYFITYGAIDARKNQTILLEAWKNIGQTTNAKLLILGSPTPTASRFFQLLNAHPFKDRIVVASGVSTPAIKLLLKGARAMLAPSLAEGFGLPLMEALSQGVRVVASDIPIHRETASGCDFASFVDPHDVEGWCNAIMGILDNYRSVSSTGMQHHQIRTWQEYFTNIDLFIEDFARSRAR